MTDRAWREEFQKNYFERGVLFHTQLELDERGNIRMVPPPPDVDGPVQLELNDVRLLKQLVTNRPEWFFFGLRFHDAQRDENGNWRVSYQPDSAVLITDFDVLHPLRIKLDAGMRERIESQAILWENLRGK